MEGTGRGITDSTQRVILRLADPQREFLQTAFDIWKGYHGNSHAVVTGVLDVPTRRQLPVGPLFRGTLIRLTGHIRRVQQPRAI